MEKIVGKTCLKCGGKLTMRCGTCHKNRSNCRNEYCTGQSELACLSCGKAYINGNYSVFANGQLLNNYVTTGRFFTDLETFQFQQSTSVYEFEGEVYGIQVFDEALDNNEIAKLTELWK